jgi:hypothetical protein
MPGCILRVVGQAFEPETILAGLSLRPYAIFRRGDKCFPESQRSEKLHDFGGFKCDVSSPDDNLAGQVIEAITFLSEHYEDLAQLASVPAIEAKYLDFGYCCRLDSKRCCVQCDYLPADLLRLCGELGIGIELSLYPPMQR